MKKINATTTYNPNLSTMQEIEYTMPQAKKGIANCLMNALDNLKDQQAEIDELVNMLLYCNPVPAKKTQYEALMDKHKVNKPHDSWCKSQIGEFCNCSLSLDKHRGK